MTKILKPKAKPVTNPDFDSPEEEWFSWYLEELVQAGLASRWSRAETYDLSPPLVGRYLRLKGKGPKAKEVVVEKDILKKHSYTPDFSVWWTEEAYRCGLVQNVSRSEIKDSTPILANPDQMSVFEVKPFFDRHGKTTWATCQIKWLYQLQGTFVQLVKVGSNKTDGIFSKSFTPAKYLLTRTGKDRKLHHDPITLQEFLKASHPEW